MRIITVRTSALVFALGAITVGSTSASAACSPGFLADVACQLGIIDQPTARTLDGAHSALGRPLDRAAPGIAGAIGGPGAAGAARAWQQWDRARRGYQPQVQPPVYNQPYGNRGYAGGYPYRNRYGYPSGYGSQYGSWGYNRPHPGAWAYRGYGAVPQRPFVAPWVYAR